MDELASKYKGGNALEKNQSNETTEHSLEGSNNGSVESLSQHKDIAVDSTPLEN
jgi:hypothetical protein